MQKNNKNGIKHFLAFMECMDKGMKSKVEVAKILTKQLEEIAEETGFKDIDFSVSTESLTRFLLLEMSVNFDTDELIPLLSFSGEKEDFLYTISFFMDENGDIVASLDRMTEEGEMEYCDLNSREWHPDMELTEFQKEIIGEGDNVEADVLYLLADVTGQMPVDDKLYKSVLEKNGEILDLYKDAFSYLSLETEPEDFSELILLPKNPDVLPGLAIRVDDGMYQLCFVQASQGIDGMVHKDYVVVGKSDDEEEMLESIVFMLDHYEDEEVFIFPLSSYTYARVNAYTGAYEFCNMYDHAPEKHELECFYTFLEKSRIAQDFSCD